MVLLVGGGWGGGWVGWADAWVGWAGEGGACSRGGARDSPLSGWKGVLPREQRRERGVYAADYEQWRVIAWAGGLGDGM